MHVWLFVKESNKNCKITKLLHFWESILLTTNAKLWKQWCCIHAQLTVCGRRGRIGRRAPSVAETEHPHVTGTASLHRIYHTAQIVSVKRLSSDLAMRRYVRVSLFTNRLLDLYIGLYFADMRTVYIFIYFITTILEPLNWIEKLHCLCA